jgi:hypothetical protein
MRPFKDPQRISLEVKLNGVIGAVAQDDASGMTKGREHARPPPRQLPITAWFQVRVLAGPPRFFMKFMVLA